MPKVKNQDDEKDKKIQDQQDLIDKLQSENEALCSSSALKPYKEDGVWKCLYCHWEFEEGACEHCGKYKAFEESTYEYMLSNCVYDLLY
jgi:ribosomal protein L37AE/L43A